MLQIYPGAVNTGPVTVSNGDGVTLKSNAIHTQSHAHTDIRCCIQKQCSIYTTTPQRTRVTLLLKVTSRVHKRSFQQFSSRRPLGLVPVSVCVWVSVCDKVRESPLHTCVAKNDMHHRNVRHSVELSVELKKSSTLQPHRISGNAWIKGMILVLKWLRCIFSASKCEEEICVRNPLSDRASDLIMWSNAQCIHIIQTTVLDKKKGKNCTSIWTGLSYIAH